MTISAPTRLDDRPVCAEPAFLPLVDASFDQSGVAGSDARAALARLACGQCALRAACLTYALANNEHGVWGGTTERRRNKARGHMPYSHNLRDVHRGGALGGPRVHGNTAEVRAWARSVGIEVPNKGVPKAEVFEAYDAAHDFGFGASDGGAA